VSRVVWYAPVGDIASEASIAGEGWYGVSSAVAVSTRMTSARLSTAASFSWMFAASRRAIPASSSRACSASDATFALCVTSIVAT
jgi:hypothetical protein